MPEYLAPGVYVEEVSFRSKSIEGVPTSTTGFAGMARFGPVQYPGGPTTTQPRLITSFTEFERVYGGLESLGSTERVNYLAHGARAYFLNGGKRLYVSRVIAGDGSAVAASGGSRAVGSGTARWRARWPGAFGNVRVETRLLRSQNVSFTYPASDLVRAPWGVQARGAKAGTMVEIIPAGGGLATLLSAPGPFPLVPGGTLELSIDGGAAQVFTFNATQATRPGGGGVFPGDGSIDTMELVVSIDDGPDQTITFQAGDTTAAAMAARINETLLGAAAVVSGGGQVNLRSDSFGTGSSVEIRDASTVTVAQSGLTIGRSVGTGNVRNIGAVTADEVVAILATLTQSSATNENGAVRVTSTSAGAGSGVVVLATLDTSVATLFQFVSPSTNSGSTLSGQGPFHLEADQTLVVAMDGGADLEFVFEATRAAKTGAGADFPNVPEDGTLVVSVDGGPSQTIIFELGDTTAEAVAARINASLVGGAAIVVGGQVNLLSDSRGLGSRVEVLAGSTAATQTGQAVGAASGTGNVQNIGAVTAAEVVAVMEGLIGGTASVEGNAVRITSGTTGASSTVQIQAASTATNLGFAVGVHGPGGTLPTGNDAPNLSRLYVVQTESDGRQRFVNNITPLPGLTANANDTISLVTMRVIVSVDRERVDVYDGLGADTDDKRYIGRILQREDPEDENAVVWLDVDEAAAAQSAELLLAALRGNGPTGEAELLAGGADGNMMSPDDLLGSEADPDNPDLKATGLEALGEIEDIAIVGAPEAATYDQLDDSIVATGHLITHAEKERYRIAVIDGPANSSMTEIREFRGKFDSKYAALYYPWIQVLDPLERAAQGAPPRKLLLPASGFVAGVYARSDIERGVHKAPANEVVRGLTQFEININKPRQDVLNPEGINALRFFPGRGSRVWGARTISSDPEWKYVNVRRLFIYLEHSIDKGTQWAVFEPNNRRLWDNIRQTVENFLLVLWRDGALLGDKPEDAYFVRCDRTTMTQNDLDNGRLICLIGVAPVKPAEFVIFRVGQWTADSKV